MLSTRMKRRLIVARPLLHRPRILTLDELTTGLDPQARQLIWQRLRQLKREGVTLILATHYMEETEQLCDRAAILEPRVARVDFWGCVGATLAPYTQRLIGLYTFLR